MSALIPLMTDAGLAACFNASSTGLDIKIAAIAVGDAAYRPDRTQIALKSERARRTLTGGEKVGPTQIHVNTLLDSNEDFWIREVGFISDTGILIAVWSHPDTPLVYNKAGQKHLLAYDLALSAVPADSINIISMNAPINLTLATEFALLSTAIVRTQHMLILPKLKLQGSRYDA
ncbi:phage tail-collar fiber domain-containing protein [Iodobacter fluviatilis]|uniref:Tail-collar fiber protein n=1 Tax=Iodobacter fluviatilis TaxID=537 RepID=A0A377QA77_9NEIS|nr:phage tail protein [Iodobacter fluviatilis]TCU81211.1 tail-collar fiber protein [Iodobacter fluviatilis]STQ91727.1 Uncharacterised protein [Iodobacter fluviatilis]